MPVRPIVVPSGLQGNAVGLAALTAEDDVALAGPGELELALERRRRLSVAGIHCRRCSQTRPTLAAGLMAEDDTTRAGATSDDAESLGAGDTFAGLRIDGIAGRGGSGVVYRAWDLQLDQPRALKVLFPDLSRGPRFKERFERESRLIASLDHPSVVTVHRAGEHGGRLFLSMQLVDGETLADLLEREGPLTRERTVSILGQVASALDAARDQGLVHRDVKPANILVAGDRAYLTDFGIAKHTVAAEPLTEPGEMVGTANYVAPEQVTGGAVSAATDIYALRASRTSASPASSRSSGRRSSRP